MRKKKRKEFDVSDIESQNGKTVTKKRKEKQKREKRRKKGGNGTTSPQPHPKHTKPVEVSQTNPDTQQ